MVRNRLFVKQSVITILCLLVMSIAGDEIYAERAGAQIQQCVLTDDKALWVQSMIDNWERVSRDFLRLDTRPLPWIVLFDDACVWHLNPEVAMLSSSARPIETPLRFAGNPVLMRALAHDGTISLPNGESIPADIIAAASPYKNGEAAFYVLALLDIWRKHPQASKDPRLEERIMSATLHEMVHTRQLSSLSQRLTALKKRYALPQQFDDNVIETRFKDVPAFRAAFAAERDMFYRAATEMDATRRRKLVARALALARERRARFFRGRNRPYAELEELFLNMEGVAEWTRFKFHQADPRGMRSDTEIIKFLRGKENDWSQDEGLALFLLLEKMTPGWQEQVLSPSMASPFKLLERTIKASSKRKRTRVFRASDGRSHR